MGDDRWSGQTEQFLVRFAYEILCLIVRRADGDARLLSRVANRLVMLSHPIEQSSQLSQDALLQARRYDGPFRGVTLASERNTGLGGVPSPINMERIAQDTSVDGSVISGLLATCTPRSIRIYPCYSF